MMPYDRPWPVPAVVHRRPPPAGEHRAGRAGVRAAEARGHDATRGSARSTPRRRRRSTSTPTRGSSTASAAASAATCSSSSSCTRRSASRTPCSMLAQKFGLPLPEHGEGGPTTTRAETRRCARRCSRCTKSPPRTSASSSPRRPARAPGSSCAERGITPQTIEQLGLGFAPPSRDGLKARLLKQGFSPGRCCVQSGLVVAARQRRGRRSIPEPADDSDLPGHRVGHRVRRPRDGRRPAAEVPEFARDADLLEGPDALRPEPDEGGDPEARVTPSWSRATSTSRRCSRPEAAPVVASCGTALTPQQAQLLRRFTSKVVLSFDPDAAGQGAAARSCELLVAEGFDVNVVVLDKGEDPDTFIRQQGRATGIVNGCAVRGRTWNTCSIRRRPALDFGHDESRRQFLGKMLDGRRPDSGRGRARPVRRPARAQGADYGRGRPGRDPQGGRQPADDA